MSLLIKMQYMLENVLHKIWQLVPSASGKILTNKWILYFIFIVGIYDVIHFYQRGNSMAVAIFFIVGFLTAFFSKNMIVVIVCAIAVSHIVAYGNKMEGFEDEEEEEGFEEGAEEDATAEDAVAEDTENKKKKTTTPDDATPDDAFTTQTNDNQINQLLSNMNDLLKQTEQIITSSKPNAFSGMEGMSYADYK